MIHRLLKRCNYCISPEEFYRKPKHIKNFIYASLDLETKEKSKNK